eukprot:TRINITY_DN1610_c0_g1_i18.p2 TRINITY_DN1610_c0_g1~~TRINITY_DN1610_c0_g1_i18.p2  ORF type:complete len:106 (+),score=0.08 TRINITY_DN1610_c0_g1_i18:95-412(+)
MLPRKNEAQVATNAPLGSNNVPGTFQSTLCKRSLWEVTLVQETGAACNKKMKDFGKQKKKRRENRKRSAGEGPVCRSWIPDGLKKGKTRRVHRADGNVSFRTPGC